MKLFFGALKLPVFFLHHFFANGLVVGLDRLGRIIIYIFLLQYSYAKIHIPIIASVSEHQPTTWVSFFFDLHILVCVFPFGLWTVIKNINNERVFSKFNFLNQFVFSIRFLKCILFIHLFYLFIHTCALTGS